MILPVVLGPNAILNQISQDIEDINGNIVNLLNNMKETMYKRNGIGLAAPQVNKSINAIVVDVKYDGSEAYLMINPRIVSQSENLSSYNEGCLSYPKSFVTIFRPAEIEVSYIDINGNDRKVNANGLFATCLQHEIDHLKGKTIIDYVMPPKLQEEYNRKAEKIKKKLIDNKEYI